MKVTYGLNNFKTISCAVATTGTFDGVHLGHRKILNQLVAKAKKVGGESVLLTFSPHPRIVLQPDVELELLSSENEKISLLEKTGIDHLIIHPFTREFSRTQSLDFVREFLVNKIGVKHLVIGYDHHFGRNREGSFDHLKEFGPIYGFEVEEIAAFDIDQVNVSSTKIRNALAEGNVELANMYLGAPYSISGRVIKGNQIGRTIGFPTANIECDFMQKLLPADGVYAGKLHVNGHTYNAMANLGSRPTIGSKQRKLEVHCIGTDIHLYESEVRFELYKFLRGIEEFANLEALKKQLEVDKKEANLVLAQ
ncbi:bifunctional riboflavin kinase/FAD synthetase [Schleiferiaceae bacterium]|nr:bifunctional riboflavin kinase/FAD synthetase [Schleiferiaceae bacterium]MDB2473614.1 bifunctional riboflavin kinase/FAD synthetase [Schleiferiaceae bacterium]